LEEIFELKITEHKQQHLSSLSKKREELYPRLAAHSVGNSNNWGAISSGIPSLKPIKKIV